MPACKNCNLIVKAVNVCPSCGSTEFTDKYSGLIIIMDIQNSEIAKLLNIKMPGHYAVKVK